MVRRAAGSTQWRPGGPAVIGPTWPRGQQLQLAGVTLRRGGATILDRVEATFEPGRRYVLVGPSGAGKSSLLRLLNRLDVPSEGVVRIGATPLADLPARVVRRAVGMVFQASRPLPGTLRANLAYPHEIVGGSPTGAVLGEALEAVGLNPTDLDRDAASLSGGERQRLALAVTLQTDPEVVLLDEPTAALDAASARRLADLLDGLARDRGLRTIAVCHQIDVALWLGDTAVVMDRGRIVEVGPMAAVAARGRAR